MMRLLNRGKEEEKPPEGEIPDEFVMLVAKKLFEKYGDAIAETINKKISQQLEPIRSKIAQMEKEIQYLKATSDEKIKDLLKSTIEVAMESVAEKSAKKAVEYIGVDKIESLSDSAKTLKEIQIEMAEKLESVSKVLNTVEKSLSELTRTLEDVSVLGEEIRTEVDSSLEQFNQKVENAVNMAVKSIRENVVVDKGLIESVVSQSLSRIVSSKFTDIESKIEGLLSKVDALSNSVKELKKMEDTLNIVISKVDGLEEAVKEIKVSREQIATTQDELQEKTQRIKETQDEEEWIPKGMD